MSRGLSDMWRSVVLFLPSALTFLAIVFAGYLLARLARTLTGKALRRAGFDRVVAQGPAGRLIRPGTPGVTDVCARLAFFVVLLFALQLAFGIWGPNPAGDLINALVSWLPQVFVAIVIVVVTTAVARAAHDLTLAVLGSLAYARVTAKVVTAVIVTLGVVAGLDQIGIATSVTRPLLITILATVAGVIIVGVGGGLIRPMQQRWEGWLDRAAAESAAIRSQARAYAEERARQAAAPSAAPPADPAAGSAASPSGSPAPAGFSGPAGAAAAGSAEPGTAPTETPGSHGAPFADAAENAGPAEGRASTADAPSVRPDQHPDADPGPPGQGAVEGSQPDPMTARDARRAGAADLAAEVRRAASVDRSPTAQGAAGGGAVAAGVQDQESAGAAVAEAQGQEPASGEQSSQESGSPDREAGAAGAVPAGDDSRRRDTPGAVSAAGDSTAGGADAPAYPEETEDWSWEKRWAEQERRAGERSGEATTIVDASEAGVVDDLPHLIPGFDRYEDRVPADDDDPTIFVHIGTAETTLLTPGVRPAAGLPEPAPDDDPTIAGHDRDAARTPGEAWPDRPAGADPAADDATTSFVVGGPDVADPTVSLDGGSGDDTTSFVVGGPGSGDPTVMLEGGSADGGEPTTMFAVVGSAGGGSDTDAGEAPTTVITGVTADGEVAAARSWEAGDSTEERTAESRPRHTADGEPAARRPVSGRETAEPGEDRSGQG